MSKSVLGIVFVLLITVSASFAFEVYINGQPYRGHVKNQAVQGATLQFDAQGNLTIDAPALLQKTGATAEKTAQGPGVFLIVNNVQTGQYMVKATVNGTKVLIVRATQKQGVTKIDHLVKPGKNTLDLVYYPDPDSKAGASGTAVEVMVGQGTESKDGLVLKQVFAKQAHEAGKKGAEMKSAAFELPESKVSP